MKKKIDFCENHRGVSLISLAGKSLQSYHVETPVHVRSPMLSNVELGHFLDR